MPCYTADHRCGRRELATFSAETRPVLSKQAGFQEGKTGGEWGPVAGVETKLVPVCPPEASASRVASNPSGGGVSPCWEPQGCGPDVQAQRGKTG